MVLLLKIRPPKSNIMAQAVRKVFDKRNTHSLPQKLEPLPPEWQTQFNILAIECGLPHDMQINFKQIFKLYDSFIN